MPSNKSEMKKIIALSLIEKDILKEETIIKITIKEYIKIGQKVDPKGSLKIIKPTNTTTREIKYIKSWKRENLPIFRKMPEIKRFAKKKATTPDVKLILIKMSPIK